MKLQTKSRTLTEILVNLVMFVFICYLFYFVGTGIGYLYLSLVGKA